MRGRWSNRAAVVTALFVLLSGCTRPQGVQATPTLQPSPTPVASHDPLTVASPTFHAGEIGVAYAPVTLSATGGVTPYHWTVSVGSLPGGLDLSADGIISGTPTANGNYAFSVLVFDADSDTAGVTASIPIAPRLAAGLVSACALECSVELGCVSACGTFGQVSGGAAPFTYSLTGGVLPSGTTLSGLALNGTFTGLPGRLQFTVRVTDGFGATATIAPTYSLLPHIFLASGVCFGDYTTGCSAQLQVTGGSGAASVRLLGEAQNPNPNSPNQGTCWTLTDTKPPAGYSLTTSSSYVSVSIPMRIINGYGAIWTLVVTDHNLCGPNTYCTSPAATVRIGVQCG